MRLLALLLLLGCGDEQFGSLFVFVSDPAPNLQINVQAEIRLSTDGEPPILWGRSGGIPGMAIEDEGGNQATYRGAPTSGGNFAVTFTAQDARDFSGSGSLFTMIRAPNPPPMFTGDLSSRATIGIPFSAVIGLVGGEPPLVWTATGTPAGLAFSEGIASITGTPEEVGSFPIALRVDDLLGRTARGTFQLEVRELLQFQTLDLPNGIVGFPYRAELIASGGEPPYRWTVDGRGLPDGLEIIDGALRGTPLQAGEFEFGLTVIDAWDQFGSESYILTIAAQAADPAGALWPIPPFGRTEADFIVYTSSIVDPITHIAWSSAAIPADAIGEAEAHCLSLGADWRLPTRIEFASIGAAYGADLEAPIDAPYLELWSAGAETWGGPGPGDRGVICARADPVAAVSRYQQSGGGNMDLYTGLVWSGVDLPCASDHVWGARFCSDLEEAERTDWRQPNVRELMSAHGPDTIGARGFFVDPDAIGAKLDATGSVVRTSSSAEQWCVRDVRDCREISLPQPLSLEPLSPTVGSPMTIIGLGEGGGSCPIQYHWMITGPDGSRGWPSFVPLQEALASNSVIFAPLLPGQYEVWLIVNVDGHRTSRRNTFDAVPAPCELSVTIEEEGARLRARASGGAAPYLFAWSRETEYCAGLAGVATGFTATETVEYQTAPGFPVEHRAVVTDAEGCLGIATIER